MNSLSKLLNQVTIVLVSLGFALTAGVNFSLAQSPDSWSPRQAASYVNRSASIALNGKIYVFGSDDPSGAASSFSRVYDPTTDQWTTLAPMPTRAGAPAIATMNGLIYIIGGYNPNNGALYTPSPNQIYDPSTNSWSTASNPNVARAFATAQAVGGKIFLIGGCTCATKFSDVEQFDPGTNTWSTMASMPTARAAMVSAVVGTTIYVIGGSNDFAAIGTTEAYDTGQNSWSTKTPMPTARSEFGAALVGNHIFAFGGNTSAGYVGTQEEYDPSADTWIARAPLPVAMAGNTGTAVNGLAYSIGINRTDGRAQVNYAYTPISQCPVNLNDVKLRLIGLSLDGKPIGMRASFTPSNGQTLAELALDCGFTNFDWAQTIEQWPGPSGLYAQTAPNIPIIIPPQLPINDPPLGGYTYQFLPGSLWPQLLPNFATAAPFYYSPLDLSSGCAVLSNNGVCSEIVTSNFGFTLNFLDAPSNVCLPGGGSGLGIRGRIVRRLAVCGGPTSGPPFMSFKTQLVGICNDTPSAICNGAGKPSAPLFQWTWNSNFNGFIANRGGVFGVQTASFRLADSGTGNGGVMITSVNGAPQTPPVVSCTAALNVVESSDNESTLVKISGNVSSGTSTIVPDGATFIVIDHEGKVRESGPVIVGSSGAYSFEISLPASHRDNDRDDRPFTIAVTVPDTIGNFGSCSIKITDRHDDRSGCEGKGDNQDHRCNTEQGLH